MSRTPRAIHFGAGNIGRGFIAPLLSKSGYHLVFTDVDKQLIQTINDEKSYGVHVLDTDSGVQVEQVNDVRAVLSTTDDIIHEIAHPDLKLITTAVGLGVLEKVAPTLARGITARREAGGGTINVIACENAIGATSQLADHVHSNLSSDADKEYISTHVGFPNCTVDRIVPPFDPSSHESADSTLDVGVEEFFEWIVDLTALKPPNTPHLSPPVDGMALTSNLPAYNERKLFTLNTGHATAAYLGHLARHDTLPRSIADPEIRDTVRSALIDESGAALCRKYPDVFQEEKHKAYVDKILARFGNEEVGDDIARVARQPLRKLAPADRLVGPARMCLEHNVPVQHLATGIAAALLYHDEEDEQSVEMRRGIRERGIGGYVGEVTGFEEGGEVHGRILGEYEALKKKYRIET